MKKEVFITKLEYKNKIYSIFLTNGKYVIKTKNEIVNNDISKKIINLIYDRNKIKTKNEFFFKYKNKKMSLIELTKLAGIILGTGITLTYIRDEEVKQENKYAAETNYDNPSLYQLKKEGKIFDSEVLINYIHAIYTNPNLSLEDKKILADRFNYIKKNQMYINLDFLYETLNNVTVNRLSWSPENVSGEFVLNEDGKPFINLYSNATHETFLHEIYHLIHYNKYYWDDVYYYKNMFIGSDEYNSLSKENQSQCEQIEILGNMIEEAYTTLNTSEEENTSNIPLSYDKEAYIYKMYEKILGKEELTECMFDANQVKSFLNLLLKNGCTKDEAIAITARLDLYNTLTLKKNKENTDILKYQICDDLYYIYKKKYGNTNDILLKCSALAVCNNGDIEYIINNLEDKKCLELINLIKGLSFDLKSFVPDSIIFDQNISKIEIDYFTLQKPMVYFTLNDGSILIFLVENNTLVFNKFEKNTPEITVRPLDLYNDYYTFALNKYNDIEYATFFASIYANTIITVEEKAYLLEYYEAYQQLVVENPEHNLDLINASYNEIIKKLRVYEKNLSR